MARSYFVLFDPDFRESFEFRPRKRSQLSQQLAYWYRSRGVPPEFSPSLDSWRRLVNSAWDGHVSILRHDGIPYILVRVEMPVHLVCTGGHVSELHG